MWIEELSNVNWASLLWEEVEKRGGVEIDHLPIKQAEPQPEGDSLAHFYCECEIFDSEELVHSLEDFQMLYAYPGLISIALGIVELGRIKVGHLPLTPTTPGNRVTVTYDKIPVRFQVGYQAASDGPGRSIFTFEALVEEVKTAEAVMG